MQFLSIISILSDLLLNWHFLKRNENTCIINIQFASNVPQQTEFIIGLNQFSMSVIAWK